METRALFTFPGLLARGRHPIRWSENKQSRPELFSLSLSLSLSLCSLLFQGRKSGGRRRVASRPVRRSGGWRGPRRRCVIESRPDRNGQWRSAFRPESVESFLLQLTCPNYDPCLITMRTRSFFFVRTPLLTGGLRTNQGPQFHVQRYLVDNAQYTALDFVPGSFFTQLWLTVAFNGPGFRCNRTGFIVCFSSRFVESTGFEISKDDLCLYRQT